jgi:hypothetical protein
VIFLTRTKNEKQEMEMMELQRNILRLGGIAASQKPQKKREKPSTPAGRNLP